MNERNIQIQKEIVKLNNRIGVLIFESKSSHSEAELKYLQNRVNRLQRELRLLKTTAR